MLRAIEKLIIITPLCDERKLVLLFTHIEGQKAKHDTAKGRKERSFQVFAYLNPRLAADSFRIFLIKLFYESI